MVCTAVALCLVLFAVASPPRFAQDTAPSANRAPLKPGLQVGEKVPSFYVRAITGPLRTKSVCYVCRNGDRPVVMLLVRKITPELPGLLKKIDEIVDENRAVGLRSFGVFLAEDSKTLAPQLQTLAFDEKINLPLTVAAAPADGLGGETPHPEAAVTVLLYREQRVTANVAYREGELGADQIATGLIRSVAVTQPAGVRSCSCRTRRPTVARLPGSQSIIHRPAAGSRQPLRGEHDELLG